MLCWYFINTSISFQINSCAEVLNSWVMPQHHIPVPLYVVFCIKMCLMYLYCANIVCLMHDLSIREILVNASGEESGIINGLKKKNKTQTPPCFPTVKGATKIVGISWSTRSCGVAGDAAIYGKLFTIADLQAHSCCCTTTEITSVFCTEFQSTDLPHSKLSVGIL